MYRCYCNKWRRMKHRGCYCNRCESFVMMQAYLPAIAGVVHGMIVRAVRTINRALPGFCAPIQTVWPGFIIKEAGPRGSRF